jgi:di/tricarboxylate transporter
MSIAAVSLLALLGVIVVSCFSRVNPGLLSIALAFVIGRAAGLPSAAIAGGFPSGLFVTLTGVTLLFGQARVNGTLEKVASRSVRLVSGNRGMIPIVFFFLALGLSTIGVGNIGATALLAPVAMSVAGRAGISGFLMALMLANGANAGSFSPFASGGIIARTLMARIGLEGMEWPNYGNTLVAQSVVAFAGYFLLGGLALLRAGTVPPPDSSRETDPVAEDSSEHEPFSRSQRITLGVIAALIASAVLLRVDVGLGAYVAAAILTVTRAADEEAAVRSIPWGVILMVTGLTVLVEVLAKTGGMELFSHLLARLSSPTYVTGAIALATGLVSVYSSSTGVVIPAFLPIIPSLVERLGGGSPLMIAYSINVGSHLVDVSPLSTLGALCLAAAPPSEDRERLFRKLMIWGWSMAVVGAIVCQTFFGFRG